MRVLENSAKTAQIQSRLSKYSYLSRHSLPGFADGRVFQLLELSKRFPDRSVNPNFYHWYILMKQFSPSVISKWVADQQYLDSDDALINELSKTYFYNLNEFEYTIDVYTKNWIQGKAKDLEKALEEYRAQIIEIEEKDKQKLIRVICRAQAAQSQDILDKLSALIEYANLEMKKRPVKGNLSTTAERTTTQN